jgi:hypothetical protein
LIANAVAEECAKRTGEPVAWLIESRKDAKPDAKPAPTSIEQMDDDIPF